MIVKGNVRDGRTDEHTAEIRVQCEATLIMRSCHHEKRIKVGREIKWLANELEVE